MEKTFAVDTPLYRHDGTYAREHDEINLYRESYQANIACMEKIEKTLSDNYENNHLNTEAVLDTLRNNFSMERIEYVLANTVQQKDWDGRFSRDNKAWAKTVPITPNPDPWGGDRNIYFTVDKPHSILTDALVTHFRKVLQKEKELEASRSENEWKVVMVSAGGVKHDLSGGFKTEAEAEAFAESEGWRYVDENGFEWGLEVRQDYGCSKEAGLNNAADNDAEKGRDNKNKKNTHGSGR